LYIFAARQGSERVVRQQRDSNLYENCDGWSIHKAKANFYYALACAEWKVVFNDEYVLFYKDH
jgi:hypothetical protein